MEQNRRPGPTPARARAQIVAAMVIFGTLGVFRRNLELSSGVIALARGVLGTVFLAVLMRAREQRFDWRGIRRNLLPLLGSGALLGFNWLLLFEAYRYTTVARATLCYYMAPVFVLLVAPLVLKERLTAKKMLCVLVALAGMALANGVTGGAADGAVAGFCGRYAGILLGLGAAGFYAGIILFNQKIVGLSAYERTIFQLGTSVLVLLPYLAANGELAALASTAITPGALALVAVLGIVHTGIAYALYFGAMEGMPAQSVAVLGYIDPAVAILLSALVLREPLTLPEMAGTVLVLGATLAAELPSRAAKKA